MRIFKNRSVLNNRLISVLDIHHLAESGVEEIYLQVERPTLHFFIEIVQIGIVVSSFVLCFPLIMFGKKSCKGGFPAPIFPAIAMCFGCDIDGQK